MSESSTDDEQPGPSQPGDQINNSSEIRSGGSHMDGSSGDDEQPGPSHQLNNGEIRSHFVVPRVKRQVGKYAFCFKAPYIYSASKGSRGISLEYLSLFLVLFV